MNIDLLYLLKVNVALTSFYLVYKLFFGKDTFFKFRRVMLLAGIAFAFVYPFIELNNWVAEQRIFTGAAVYYSELKEFVVTAAEGNQSNMPQMTTYAAGLYLMISLFFAVLFLLKCKTLAQIKLSSSKISHQGTTMYLPRKEMAPFSFFGWIFLNPDMYSDSELKEIIKHESTHCREWHSFDLLVAELVKIACWINPIAWLLKREIEQNLEYIADRSVVASGVDKRSYQYHLVEVACGVPLTTLNTGFNYCNLKNRIIMLNQKRSKNISGAKYALFIPLCLSFIAVNNLEAVTRIATSVVTEIKEAPEMKPFQDLTAAVFPTTVKTTREAVEVSPVMQDQKKKQEPQDEALGEVFVTVEDMPEFPGGPGELMKFIASHVKYPAVAVEKKIQGRVVVQFIVSKTGQVVDAKIARGVDPSLDAEALRVVSSMPKWKPGSQRGVPVNVKYTVPVQFKWEKPAKADSVKSVKPIK
ncbi:MAG: TonB family protein [Tannerellaceae bacterium]